MRGLDFVCFKVWAEDLGFGSFSKWGAQRRLGLGLRVTEIARGLWGGRGSAF